MIQIDMKMPEVCGECPFADYTTREYPFCTVLQADRGYPFDVNKKKFPNCPLKPAEELKAYEIETANLKDMCRVLFNRCRAVGSAGGATCVFCGMKEECKEMHSI